MTDPASALTEPEPKPSSIADYCNQRSGAAKALLHQLGALRKSAGAGIVEAIKWGQPAIVHRTGVILYMYSAHKDHANIVFTPSTREAFAHELDAYRTGKGSIQLPYGAAFPRELLQRMVTYRVQEVEQHGVAWK